jgi:1-acyl-sn-glycerol-3-phosphate acyltransferase
MHGYIYIILKESLKNIPIFGWGAQFYNFIFLARNWEKDKPRFQEHLEQLSNPNDPMWLLIFPEGTNLAKGTREKSRAWAEKQGLQDMKHQLLPRSRGLQFCLEHLKESTEWLYDVTIGYEGIPPGQFGQDIFTLRSSMFEGRPPKSVNMHFRRFKIADIPIDNDRVFEVWLRNRWREKDYLLEHFVRYNSFPQDPNWLINQMKGQLKGKKAQIKPTPARTIETQIKSNSLEEFLSIFAPLTSVMTVLFLFYGGGNPNDMLKMIADATQKHQQIALVRDDSDPEKPLKLERREADLTSVIPGKEAIKAAGDTAAQAQRNLMQKYVQAVKPQAKKQISLPDRALRAKNAGEEPFKNKLKPGKKTPQANGVMPKKAASVAGIPSKTPASIPPVSRRPSSVTGATITSSTAIPSVSATTTSTSRTIVPPKETKLGLSRTKLTTQAGPLATKPAPRLKASKGHAPIGSKKAIPKPPAAKQAAKSTQQQNGELKTFKMDKETFDKMKGKNIAQIGAPSKKTPAQANSAVKRTPPVVKAAKKAPVGVNVDPAVLEKMKAAKKGG